VNDAYDLQSKILEAVTTPGLRDRLVAGIPGVSTASDMAEQHLALYERLRSEGAPTRRSLRSEDTVEDRALHG
jgi:hypothetical protein